MGPRGWHPRHVRPRGGLAMHAASGCHRPKLSRHAATWVLRTALLFALWPLLLHDAATTEADAGQTAWLMLVEALTNHWHQPRRLAAPWPSANCTGRCRIGVHSYICLQMQEAAAPAAANTSSSRGGLTSSTFTSGCRVRCSSPLGPCTYCQPKAGLRRRTDAMHAYLPAVARLARRAAARRRRQHGTGPPLRPAAHSALAAVARMPSLFHGLSWPPPHLDLHRLALHNHGDLIRHRHWPLADAAVLCHYVELLPLLHLLLRGPEGQGPAREAGGGGLHALPLRARQNNSAGPTVADFTVCMDNVALGGRWGRGARVVAEGAVQQDSGCRVHRARLGRCLTANDRHPSVLDGHGGQGS